MRKIMILGTGAQGSTIAKRMQEEPSVEEIVCADYDMRAAEDLEKSLSKAKAVQVDGSKVENIVAAAKGCELIVNGLPPDFNTQVLDQEGRPDRVDQLWLCAGYRERRHTRGLRPIRQRRNDRHQCLRRHLDEAFHPVLVVAGYGLPGHGR